MAKPKVTIEKTAGGGFLVKGLPLIREGEWNGRDYSKADLGHLASNFERIRQADQVVPPMRPFHAFTASGEPVPTEAQDARKILGWMQAVRHDEGLKMLRADIDVPDAETVRDIANKKLRYPSSEIQRSGYRIATTGEVLQTPALRGAAFVDNPGCKGLDFDVVVLSDSQGREVVTNYEDYDVEGMEALGEVATGAPMRQVELPAECFLIVGDKDRPETWAYPYRDADTTSERVTTLGASGSGVTASQRYSKAGPISRPRVKALLASGIRTADLPEDAQRKLEAAATACGMNGTAIESLIEGRKEQKMSKWAKFIETLKGVHAGTVEPGKLDEFAEEEKPETKPETNSDEGKSDPAIETLTARLTAQETQITTLTQQLAQRDTNAREAQLIGMVDKLVAERIIPPAEKPTQIATLRALMDAPEIETLAADGKTTVKVKALDAHLAMLKARAPKGLDRIETQGWNDDEKPAGMTKEQARSAHGVPAEEK